MMRAKVKILHFHKTCLLLPYYSDAAAVKGVCVCVCIYVERELFCEILV